MLENNKVKTFGLVEKDNRYLSNEEYHKTDAIGSTDLKKILSCPKKFYSDKSKDDTNKSSQMLLGSLVHTLFLEKEKFKSEYVIVDSKTKNTNKYKDAVAKELERKDNVRTVITQQEFDLASSISESILNSESYNIIINESSRLVCESSVFWKEDDIEYKCRPDLIVFSENYNPILVDIKTTRDASPDAFSKSVVNFGYDLSAAHYLKGLSTASIDCSAAILLAVETTYPFVVQAYVLGDDTINRGYIMRDKAIDRLLESDESNPSGYCHSSIEELNLPGWAMKDL